MTNNSVLTESLEDLCKELEPMIAAQKELEAKINEKKATITSIMGATSTKSVTAGKMKISYISSSSSTKFDKTKAAENLVTSGVNPDIVRACFEGATESVAKKPYLMIRIK